MDTRGGTSFGFFAKQYKGSYISYVITFFFYFLAMALFSSVLSVYLTGIGKSATEMSFIVSAGACSPLWSSRSSGT